MVRSEQDGRPAAPVRRNQSALSGGERRRFVRAVLELKRRGGYDALVQVHYDRMASEYRGGPLVGHRAPSFLPWHRQFLLVFERALQSIDPQVTVPYWDWTVDSGRTSALWAAEFLGGDGRRGDGQVVTGPFAYRGGDWTLAVRLDDRPFLTRAMGARAARLPTRAQLSAVLGQDRYDAWPWDGTPTEGFRNRLEGFVAPWLHNAVHEWVGGHMLTAVSPNDPVFWLHHCFIDKCWTEWCAAHRGAGYLPAGDTTGVLDVDETMPPWNDHTPADLLDHSRFYTYA